MIARQHVLGPVLVALALTGTNVGALLGQYPTEPPAPAPLSPLGFPPFQEARLSNGLEILLVEDHDLPIVSISLTIPTGAVHDPANELGLASMVAALLTKGTATRTAEQIAAEIEGVGGSLNAGAGDDFLTVSSTVLTDHAGRAFTLLSDVLLNPTFPEEELELARTRRLSALRLERSDPAAIADRFFARAMYGSHPYGLRETETTIGSITRASVVEFARTHLRPRGALLVVAGDMTLEQARRYANQSLGQWQGAVPRRAHGSPPAPRPTEILLVHRPGSEQSNIIYGNLGLRPGAHDYYALTVSNKVLGGGADSRLFLILREQKGWTYGANSSVNQPLDVGTFRARAEVRTVVTDSALGEMLHQLRRIRTEAIPDSELTNARAFLTGVFPLTIQTPQQIAGQVSAQKRLGLGDDYLRQYRERIAAVTAGHARAAMSRVVHPDSAVIVVVGDGTAIYDLLTPFAPVRIIDVEGNPLTPEDLTPAATAVAYDLSQIETRRDSFQLVIQGNAMGSRVSEVTEEGEDLVYVDRLAIPVAGMNLESRIAMDPETLDPRSVDERGQAQGQEVDTRVVFTDGRATGRAQTPQPGGAVKVTEIDTTVAAGTILNGQVLLVVAALPLEERASFTLSTFDTEDAATKPYTVTVDGVDEITVPAGTFSAFRVSVTGGDAPLTVYVTRESPRKVVKLEVVGTPLVFELVQ